MNIFKRFRTLWILSGWDIKSGKKDGTFTFDGIIQPQNTNEKPRMAVIIKRENLIKKVIEEEN